MEKLYFAIYKDENKQFCHKIVYRKSKKLLSGEIRGEGFLPKAIFSEKEVVEVMAGEFYNTTVSEKELLYLENHLDEWEQSF